MGLLNKKAKTNTTNNGSTNTETTELSNNGGGTNTTDSGHSSSSGTITLTPKAEEQLVNQQNKKALANTKEQQKMANDLADYMVLDKIDEDIFYKLQENAEKGIPLPKIIPFKGSEEAKKFREQYMPETLKQNTSSNDDSKSNDNNDNGGSNDDSKSNGGAKPKADNELTWVDIMKEAGGDKEKAKQLLINKYPGYIPGDKTKADLGEDGLKEIEEGRAKVIEEKETSNKQIAAKDLSTGTEGEINATADVLQEKIDDSNNKYAKEYADRVKEFMNDDVNDYYIEGLPKGVWRQYKSGAFGYSKEQAQKELDKLHEGEITWSKKRRDYLLKHPELANEEEKKIIESYKEAKNTFGTFILDVIANGLSNASKAVMGKDIDLNAGLTAEMMKTNLNKALERRNENYGTSHQNQWKALVDSMDLSKEAKQKLQDIKIERSFQKAFAKLDRETQKAALDAMATWNFSPSQVADLVAAREILKEDPDAKDIVLSQLASKGIDLAEKKGVLGFLGL